MLCARLTLRWHAGINSPALPSENGSLSSLCSASICVLSLEQFSNSVLSLRFKTPRLSAVCSGMWVQGGGGRRVFPPSKNSWTSRVKSKLRSWVIPNHWVKYDNNKSWHLQSMLSKYFCGMFPASPHLTLVTLTLLYGWENGSAERLVICPRTKQLANMVARTWLRHPHMYPRRCFSSVALEAWAGQQGSREICDCLVCWAAHHGATLSTAGKNARRRLFSGTALVQPTTCHRTDSGKNGPHHWNTAKITAEFTLACSLLSHIFLQITGNQQNQGSNDVLKLSIEIGVGVRPAHQWFLFLCVESPVKSIPVTSGSSKRFKTDQCSRARFWNPTWGRCLRLPLARERLGTNLAKSLLSEPLVELLPQNVDGLCPFASSWCLHTWAPQRARTKFKLNFIYCRLGSDGSRHIVTGSSSSQGGVRVGSSSQPLWAMVQDSRVCWENEVCTVVCRENKAGALRGCPQPGPPTSEEPSTLWAVTWFHQCDGTRSSFAGVAILRLICNFVMVSYLRRIISIKTYICIFFTY